MKDEDIIKIAAIGFIGLVVAPVVIGSVINLGSLAAAGVVNGINKVKFNTKIKKGLKDGSIIEIDGKFYEIDVENIVEEA